MRNIYIIMVIILILFIVYQPKSELFAKDIKTKMDKQKTQEVIKSSHEPKEKTFEDIVKNGIKQDTTFDDPLFKNTKYYEFKEGEYSGADQCNDECLGNCLEYGVTGNAWCFID